MAPGAALARHERTCRSRTGPDTRAEGTARGATYGTGGDTAYLTVDRVIAVLGVALAAAVALDAFVPRTLPVPALMHLLGGADGWLPRPPGRSVPRVGIEPPEARAAHERLAATTDAEAADVPAEEEQRRDVRDTTG